MRRPSELTPEAHEYETVLYEVDDRVAIVTLNRPEVHNALSFQLRSDIVAALRRAEQDPTCRSFCSRGRASRSAPVTT